MFNISFILLGIALILSALGVVLSRSSIYSALFLTVNLVLMGVAYLLLAYPFLAVAQVLIYAGAVMVVFLFALNILPQEFEVNSLQKQFFSGVGAFAAVTIAYGVYRCGLMAKAYTTDLAFPALDLKTMAESLYGDYVAIFEFSSALILLALLAVVVLVVRKPDRSQEEVADA